MKKNKLLLIGWDAADWQLINPLLKEGKLPALQSVIDRGVYGNLSTMNPAFSPMLWSTVATGKTPDKHGILDFIEIAPDRKGVRPVSTKSRKARAIWNILHNQGFTSNIVGWWPSYPTEPINGVMVSDKFQKVSTNPEAPKVALKDHVIHPNHLKEEFEELRMYPYEVTEAHILPFFPKASEINQEVDYGIAAFSKMLAESTSIHCAATRLLRTTEWDFMAVYYDMIDHFCHAYMKYHPPKLNSIPQKLYDVYNYGVRGAYIFQDMMLERTLNLIDEDTTIIIMSDHGFESGNKRITKMPELHAAPAMDHRQFGIFLAAGPNIKKNEKMYGLTLLDIAPTILHHFNLPVGKDMDGKVALDIYNSHEDIQYIESWEEVKGDFAQLDENQKIDMLEQHETMQQLIELGYIAKPDDDVEVSIHQTQCNIKHNLSKVLKGKGDLQGAKKILLELITEKEPINIIPYYVDLLAVSLKLEEFDKAEEYLNQLKELDKEFLVNTYFSEAKILLGKGKIKEALDVLNRAKDRKPSAEVWYQIGQIYIHLDRYEEAKTAIENAIALEKDKAKNHRALAEILLRLKDYRGAVNESLNSIELVKFYPDAHQVLGEALEKLGYLKEAKMAFETASKLQPKDQNKSNFSFQNVEAKLKAIETNDKANFKKWDNQITVVSGLPRSGTSLMMQILYNGGLDFLGDEVRKADSSNPKGYFEYEPVKSLYNSNAWLSEAQNKSIKIVAPLLKHLNPNYRYKIIFMNRDLSEILKSQQKMMGKNEDTLSLKIWNDYVKMLNQIEIWKEKQPGVELIYIDYAQLVENPHQYIDKIQDFLGIQLDEEKMIKSIDKDLYRNRKS